MNDSDTDNFSHRLRRNAGGALGVAADWWAMRWFRWLCYALMGLFLVYVLFWTIFMRNLPSGEVLRTYQPPIPTTVRDIEGNPIHSYTREHRIQLSYNDFPPTLVNAFLAAEDHNFFEHGGVDYGSIVSAALGNLTRSHSRGASTITQQVVKNLLLTNEQTYTRKIKEAILAQRIESVLTKQQILELYLNQIFLGRNSYGVQAASRAWFGKDVKDLDLAQTAFLAELPKSAIAFDPDRHMDRALDRRKYVLGEMLRYNFIKRDQYDAAMNEPLQVIDKGANAEIHTDGYYMEEVRRQLIDQFGETAQDGPYSVYGGGLWVRTSYNPHYQSYAEQALRDGLVRYDRGHGWSGPVRQIQLGNNWQSALIAANLSAGYADWKVAVVIERQPNSNVATIGFADGKTGQLPFWAANQPKHGTSTAAFNTLQPGDCILEKQEGNQWVLRNLPEVSGGMVVEDPHTGRVLAMQGGFDSQLHPFNNATQAWRQPGSSFKPFVYETAMEKGGMTPATILMDAPFCVFQSAKLGRKCFKNFGGGGGSGPHTLRWGVEQSRNLMTVRAASETGMKNVVATADAVGIHDKGDTDHKYPAVLSVALGSGETTVARMVNAYSILDMNGRETKQTLIDYAQDRNGKVVWPANWKPCDHCNAPDWDGKPMPRPPHSKKNVIDPESAFQTVHIMEGVIQRGTAVLLRDMDRPLFGKTGTTTGPKEVWFVGGSPDLVAGLYMGYDIPRNMGGYAQGGTLAVPIFKDFAEQAMVDMPVVPFRGAPGIRMVRIERGSGRRVFGTWPGDDPDSSVIWEAFKPESEPLRSIRRDEIPTSPGHKHGNAGGADADAPHRRRNHSDGSDAGNTTTSSPEGIY